MNFNSEFLRDPNIMEVIVRNPSAITTLLRLWDWASVHAKDFNYFGQSGKKVGIIPYPDLAAISARLLPDPRRAGTARPAGLSRSSDQRTHCDVAVHELQTLEDWFLLLPEEGEKVYLIDWRKWVVPPSSRISIRDTPSSRDSSTIHRPLGALYEEWRKCFPSHKIDKDEFRRMVSQPLERRMLEGWPLADLVLAIKGYSLCPYYRARGELNPITPLRSADRTTHCLNVARSPEKFKAVKKTVGHSAGSASGSHTGDANEF